MKNELPDEELLARLTDMTRRGKLNWKPQDWGLNFTIYSAEVAGVVYELSSSDHDGYAPFLLIIKGTSSPNGLNMDELARVETSIGTMEAEIYQINMRLEELYALVTGKADQRAKTFAELLRDLEALDDE